eukprot:255511_1
MSATATPVVISMIELQCLITGYIRETMKLINRVLPMELIEIVYKYFNTLFDHIELEPVQQIIKWLQQLNETEKKIIIQSYEYLFESELIDVQIEIPEYLKQPNILSAMVNKLNTWQSDINCILNKYEPYFGKLDTIEKQSTFWKSKLSAINHIKSELKTLKIYASVLVLHKNNNTMKARAFADYIKLSQVPNETGLLNVLFSEFPTD